MAAALHLFELLKKPPADLDRGLCLLYGSDRFLQQLALEAIIKVALGEQHDDVPLGRYDKAALWRDVADELNTVSLFGGDSQRVVIVDEADSFLSEYRDKLEKMLESPPAGLLVLLLSKCNGNSKIYKGLAAAEPGRLVHCGPPTGRGGKADSGKIGAWLQDRASQNYQLQLTRDGAAWLEELCQGHFGLMEQGLIKLSLVLDKQDSADGDQVQSIVGGWKSESIWNLIDTAAAGNSATALAQLDKLILSGDTPFALLGQIAWSLRRFAQATYMFLDAEGSNQRLSIGNALIESGFKDWSVKENSQRLKQIQRQRGQQLYQWLRDADRALKSWASRSEPSRLVLEQLIVKLDGRLREPASQAG